jgi:hypothetical protein
MKPGIQNAVEAMKVLGIQSDLEFKAIAEKSKAAFDVMKASGTASARELQEAFKKVATDAINANKGVAPEWVKTEAAVRGVTIAVDANGKATVESADKSKKAIEEVTRAYIPWGEAALRAADAAAAASEKVLAAKERVIAIQEKENALIERAIDLENKRLGIDRDKFSVDKDGKRIEVSGITPTSAFNEAKNAGLSEKSALAIQQKYAAISNSNDARFGDFQALYKEINRLKILEAQLNQQGGKGGSGGSAGTATNTNTASAGGPSVSRESGGRTVNIQIGGGNYPVQTNPQGADNLIKALQIGARNAGY